MNLHDTIQQAREWADGYKALLDGFGEVVDADADGGYLTVLALLTALDDALPHLIDTRRLAALAPSEPKYLEDVCLSFQPPDGWCVLIDDEAAPGPFFATAAEALDAAEREAQQ